MTQKETPSKGVWIALFSVLVALIVVGLSLSVVLRSDDIPSVETSDETILDPQPGDLTPPDKTAEPTEPEEIITAQKITIPGMELGMSSAEVENLLEDRFEPKSNEGNQSFDMRLTPQTANGYSLIATADNLMDDSVKAQEITAMFRPGDRDNFVLSEYNVRVQCRRGSNAENWQEQVCP